ncbi:putative polyketide synthase [Nemania sp. FL0916]|nr:putative polyketide synthase [Nemania sp. FL0916]
MDSHPICMKATSIAICKGNSQHDIGDALNGTAYQNAMVNGGYANNGGLSIAICGMACRLPGGVETPKQLWDLVLEKRDARGKVPSTRYNASALHSSVPQHGYFLGGDLGALDTSLFPMQRSDVERTDPQERLMLEIARECIEDAGVTDFRGKKIGCYIGSFGEDWTEIAGRDTQRWGGYRTADFLISNRISYEMDWKGPSMTIRTACSAALVGLNEACMAISRGDCEAALVGGTNLIMSPSNTVLLFNQGVLSKDGSCKTFSAEADGYARGEALNAIYVKPLQQALRDGNPIRAVIRATATNHNGKTNGITQPSTDAQEALIKTAYNIAGITAFEDTAMVECHGTGTPVGDSAETNAIARVFGKSGVYIGSVKPNVGHSEGASGLTSVIKMVFALESRTIPPNIKFTIPNPNIPFKSARLTVPTEVTEWPSARAERISINSFGVGGSNAHVILESATSFFHHTTPSLATTPQLLLYSAATPKSLDQLKYQYQDWVRSNPGQISELASTLAHYRDHLPMRSYATITDGVIETAPNTAEVPRKKQIVMVFTGQGAQWPQMGRELFQSNEVFRSTIRLLDQHLRGLPNPPSYSIEEELFLPAKDSRVGSAVISQPVCTAVQIALVEAFRSIGVVPSAVVGHSSGEIAAAFAAGALEASEAIIVSHYRGLSVNSQTAKGSMAAASMNYQDVEKYLLPGVTIACHNSPGSTTISGDKDVVHTVVANIRWAHPTILTRILSVDKAYHSPHMAEIAASYQTLLDQSIHAKEPRIPMFSSVTGKLMGPKERVDSEYWRTNLESPVLFYEAVNSILNGEFGKDIVFLEVGPHSALAGPLRETLAQTTARYSYIPAMVRNRDSTTSFLAAIGNLFSCGIQIDLKAAIPVHRCLPDLPRYPWNHETSHWFESRLSRDWRLGKHRYHSLLGAKVPESTDLEPSWRNTLHLQNVPWMRDHKIGNDTVFPFTGYLCMAGEAVRQTTSVDYGFNVRNVTVDMALVLSEASPTEIITTFRPSRLTSSLNSEWWDFTIASFNGHIWRKHCLGQVSAVSPGTSSDQMHSRVFTGPFPRNVSTPGWYSSMQRVGVNLGPSFQTMTEISTTTTKGHSAVSTVVNGGYSDVGDYHIHPTALDVIFQLQSVAAVNGRARLLKNWIPVSVKELRVVRCVTSMKAFVSSEVTSNDALFGQGSCIVDEEAVVEFSGIRLSLADGTASNNPLDTPATARLEWRPSLDFMPSRQHMYPSESRIFQLSLLDELCSLNIIALKPYVREIQTSHEQSRKFMHWINTQFRQNNAHLLQEDDINDIEARISEIENELQSTAAASAAKALRILRSNIDTVIKDETIENILPRETVQGVLKFLYEADVVQILRQIEHLRPGPRVLELVLNDSSEGESLGSESIFTYSSFPASDGGLVPAPQIEYVLFTIDESLEERGLRKGHFDLIVLRYTLSWPANTEHLVEKAREFLRPGGWLLLQEVPRACYWPDFIFGVMPNWPLARLEKSDDASRPAVNGFDGARCSAANLVCTVALSNTSLSPQKKVTVLRADRRPLPSAISTYLQTQGYDISECTLAEIPPPGQDIIALIDEDGPFFETLSQDLYDRFNTFLQHMQDQDCGILWVTRHSQIKCTDPRYSPVIGLARTLRTEMRIDFATCEVDDFALQPELVVKIFEHLQNRKQDSASQPDFEYSINDGMVYVGRYFPLRLEDEMIHSGSNDRIALDVGVLGRPHTLFWAKHPRTKPAANEVEIEVRSVGLNLKDVLVAMGIIELSARQFGLEAAGIVTRVGENVKDFEIGDRVCCLPDQGFASFTNCPEDFCARIPAGLSWEEAATMAIPLVTALYSLVNIGQLDKDQSVLIHSACGGVGLAAIQVAKMVGAEIYATVGTEEKVSYLMENFQIPRNKIFSSRNNTFAAGIMQETDGKGVDVVLNSLSGDLLHSSWACVAEFGTMVEIGKKDLLGEAKLDMGPFIANRSYRCVGIDHIRKRPAILKSLIRSVFDYYEKGSLKLVRPIQTYQASNVDEAFQYMLKGMHIGRINISMEPTGDLTVQPRLRVPKFDKDASYLLVGGLGGIGRSLSRYMAEHGAGELIYLSRSAGSTSLDAEFRDELQSMGCSVIFAKGDVCDKDAVEAALAMASHSLKGIIQLSMVLRDRAFSEMTFSDWQQASAPKIQGTWNLHYATLSADIDLDFFVLCSSISGQIGQPGQANYASANTFLDAFAQYRNYMGLAASVVDIGAVEDVGVLAENKELLRKMKTGGFHAISEQQLLDAMMAAMLKRDTPNPACSTNSHSSYMGGFVIGLGPMASSAIWNGDPRLAVYKADENKAEEKVLNPDNRLEDFLASALSEPSKLKTAEAEHLISVEIGRRLADMLLRSHDDDMDTNSRLSDLGMDSLVAAELRNWWRLVFRFDISVREIMGLGTLGALGKFAADKLLKASVGESDG